MQINSVLQRLTPPLRRPEPGPLPSPEAEVTDRLELGSPPRRSPALESVPIPSSMAAFRALNPDLGTLHCHDIAALKERCKRLEERGIQLIAVRHGESLLNAQGGGALLSGRGDTPLSPEGRRQAQQAAEQLLGQLGGVDWLRQAAQDPEKLPVLIASPLSRALDTGEALAHLLHDQARQLQQKGQISIPDLNRVLQLEVQQEPDLIEIDFGQCEGVNARDVAHTYPNFGKGLDFTHRFPGGEAGLDVMSRVDRFLNQVEQKQAGKTVIFFAHTMTVGISRMLLGEVTHNDQGCLFLDRSKITNATPMGLTHPKVATAGSEVGYLLAG